MYIAFNRSFTRHLNIYIEREKERDEEKERECAKVENKTGRFIPRFDLRQVFVGVTGKMWSSLYGS